MVYIDHLCDPQVLIYSLQDPNSAHILLYLSSYIYITYKLKEKLSLKKKVKKIKLKENGKKLQSKEKVRKIKLKEEGKKN